MRAASRAASATVLAAVLAALLGACRSAHERESLAAPTSRLVGVWDVTFALDSPPLGFDSAALHESSGGRVRGTLALVANHWLTASAATGDVSQARPAVYGTYDVDFSPFGFDPRDADRVPDLVATTRQPLGSASATGGDSVEVVLGPASERAQVVLRGAWRADSVVGTWRLRSAGRWGATASGHFVLVSGRLAAGRPAAAVLRTLRGAVARGAQAGR